MELGGSWEEISSQRAEMWGSCLGLGRWREGAGSAWACTGLWEMGLKG